MACPASIESFLCLCGCFRLRRGSIATPWNPSAWPNIGPGIRANSLLLWSGEFCAGPFSLEENGHKGNALLYTYMEFALVGDWILSVPSNRGKIVRILLTSRYAMWMAAGPELTFLYNDTCGKMTLGDKHPWAHADLSGSSGARFGMKSGLASSGCLQRAGSTSEVQCSYESDCCSTDSSPIHRSDRTGWRV